MIHKMEVSEFKMPKQDNAVITHPDISYQLMVEYYETSTITGSPVGPLAIHDTIASNADPLVFQESTSETVNLTINASKNKIKYIILL